MATSTITFKLDRDDYDGIIDMAGYGVGYWASAMESTDKGCHFTEDETGKKFFITPKDYYQRAIAHLVVDGEASEVGSDIADAIVQQACFGEVIYG